MLPILKFLSICAFSTFSLVVGYKYPFQDPSLSWEARVDDLLGRLTLEEIVNQAITLYESSGNTAVPRLDIKPYVWITECVHGQVGTNTTAFPHSIGLAAAFSPDLVYKMAVAVSYEVRAHWNSMRKAGKYETMVGLSCFSPVINMMRHPLWGRNQETYGEDPFLSGSIVKKFVEGLQGNHPRYIRTNAGCKHFDVHGGPENIPVDRFSFDAKVSERDWRMTFLPAFKSCVEAGSYSIMCSYNSINGIPACANKKLLTDITRKEWGFKGYIVSDAGAIANIKNYHGYTKTDAETAAVAVGAGCNLELGTSVFTKQIDAISQGLLTKQQVQDNIRPLLYTRLRLGEFDPEDMNPYNSVNMSVVQSEKHRELAVEAALQTFVLLKNDNNLLPMKAPISKIAVVGPFANAVDDLFGDYGSNVVRKFTTTVIDGLKTIANDASMAAGCDNAKCANYSPELVKSTITGANVIFVCLGTGPSVESEGLDRSSLSLPGFQLQLLQDAVQWAAGRPVVLLLFNAGPLDITWAKLNKDVGAIIECFFPSQSAGIAIARTVAAINGQAPSVPAGRLPNTWPANLNEIPAITNYTMVGSTYRYLQHTPLYPFGYGLSYSKFGYFGLQISPKAVKKGSDVTVIASVSNLGPYDADEVVQVYMSWSNVSVPVPKLQLVGFQRVSLNNGNTVKCVFTITAKQMAIWVDDNKGFDVPLGVMTIYVGGQQPYQKTDVGSNVLSGTFTITNTIQFN